jgi:N-acyl-D-amino-acid deacylase
MKFIVAVVITCVATCAHSQTPKFDLIITGGRIVDGTGNPWFRADVGIQSGHIVEVGNLTGRAASRIIRLHDEVVAPGFIDMMGDTSQPLLKDRINAESKLRQGVTTLLAGEGDSDAPQNEKTNPAGPILWRTFGEYSQMLEKKGIAINVAYDVGAGQVRQYVMGDSDAIPTRPQLEAMKELVARAMQDGAVGLTTALIYPPGSYAKPAEITELAKVVAQYGGIYMSHMRSESNHLADSINETIAVGRDAGIPSHVFHLKAAGSENWDKFDAAINTIQDARDHGLDVTADIYPYVRNGLPLKSFIPPNYFSNGEAALITSLSEPAVREKLKHEIETGEDWENWYLHVGGNWDDVLVAHATSQQDKIYEGKSIAEVAKLRGESDWNTVFDLIQHGDVDDVDPKSMNEEQKRMALERPWVSICIDEPPMNIGTVSSAHPRAFGSFPRILAKYVREDKVLTMEQAVRQMSSLPANLLQLYDRGRIAPGMAADLVIFDPETVQDTATFAKPLSYPRGIPYVIVNGKVEIDNGELTAENAGKVLRHTLSGTVAH